MNNIFIFATISTLLVSANVMPADAHGKESAQSVVVVSKVKNVTSTSFGNELLYLKTFDLIISNPTDKSINFSTSCLVATGTGKSEYKLDTIQATLRDGPLQPGKTIMGFASFSSNNASVHDAHGVKYNKNCK